MNRKPPRFPVSKRALSENGGDSNTKMIKNCYCHFWLCVKLLHLPPGWENDDQATNPLLGPSGLPGCRGRDSICSINPEKSHEKWSKNCVPPISPSAAPCPLSDMDMAFCRCWTPIRGEAVEAVGQILDRDGVYLKYVNNR